MDAGQQDFAHYHVTERLADGREAVIRAVTPADRQALRDGFARLSSDSVYARFMAARRSLTEAELDHFTNPDFNLHAAIGAEVHEGGRLLPVGVGRWMRGAGDREAEFAVTVDDAHHGLGVGTLLMKHLVVIARARGLARLTGTVLAGNHDMLVLVDHLDPVAGVSHHAHREDGVVTVVIELQARQ